MDKVKAKVAKLQELDKAPKLIATVVIGLVALVLSGLFIAMIAVGANGINRCPVRTAVPVWLLIAGISLLVALWVFVFYLLSTMFIKREGFNKITTLAVTVFLFLAAIFWFAWYLAGSYWVYGVRNRVDLDNLNTALSCDKSAYLMSFWILTIINILIFVLWIVVIVMAIARCCFKK